MMKGDLLHGFRVGEWTAEPLKGVITGPDGTSHHLQPKVMDLLVCLASSAEEPVTREALLDEVWGEYTVSDEPLTRAVAELRRALGDSSANPTYIETIPKRGYRLIQPATLLEPAIHTEEESPPRRWKLVGAPGILVVVAIFVVVRILIDIWPVADTGSAALERAPPNSIAVLPFGACNDDESMSLMAGGIASDVRNRLAQIDDVVVSARTAKFLNVVARTSSLVFWESGLEPEEISRQLHVRYLLLGNLCDQDGGLSASVSLIDDQGFLVQTRNFMSASGLDETVVVSISQQVADTVAGWLGAPSDQPTKSSVASAEALEQLLIAREYRYRGDLQKARKALDEALRLQPDYATAIFEKAFLELNGLDLDQRQGLERAREIAAEALTPAFNQFLQDPTGFESNLVVGQILLSLSAWDANLVWRDQSAIDPGAIEARYEEAENYLRAAVGANPSSTVAAESLADALDALGRKPESQQVLEAALSHDPFNPGLNWKLALRWASIDRYDDAVELLQRFEYLPFASAYTWNWQLELQRIHGHWDDMFRTMVRLLDSSPQIASHGQIRFQAGLMTNSLLHLGLTDDAEVWHEHVNVSDLPAWAKLTVDRFYLWGTGDQAELTRRTRERLAAMGPEEMLDPWYNLPMNWAWDLAAAGEFDRAIALAEKLRGAPTLRDERDTLPAFVLASIYVRAGRDVDAEPLLEQLSDHLESEIASGVVHPESLFRLAQVYAFQRNYETAVHTLQKAVEHHWRMPWWELPWNTNLNGLDVDPRVAALRRQVEEDLTGQSERIREMLAGRNLDELLAPLQAAR